MVLVVIIVLLMFKKFEIHVFINAFHSPFFDSFFLLYTFLGDGKFATIVAILMLLHSFRCSLFIACSVAISGLLVNFLKRAIFYGTPRPITYFKGLYNLYIVPGLEPNEINSFPSGHSATAFALFLCLAIIVYPVWFKYLLFCMAALVCYSRMYLSEHFLRDVFAGSVIGTIITCLVFLVFEKYGTAVWDKSVFAFINQKVLRRIKTKMS